MSGQAITPPLRVLWLGGGAVGDAFLYLATLALLDRCLGPVELMAVGSGPAVWVLSQWPRCVASAAAPVKRGFWRLPLVARQARAFAPQLVVAAQAKGWQRRLAGACGAPVFLDCGPNRLHGPGGSRPVGGPGALLNQLGEWLNRPLASPPFPRPPIGWAGLDPARLPPRQGVALAPFASAGWPSKQWPLAHYGVLARELVKQGVPVYWLCAAAEAPRLGHLLQLPGTSWPGQGSAQGLAQTLARSVVSVSGESAIAHAAPLFGATPVVLLGPTAEKFVSRFPGRPAPVVLKHATLDCLGCHQRQCPLPPPGHHACLQQLSPEEVLRAVTTALAWPTPTLSPEQDFGPDGVWANNFA